jgi:FdhD protein
MLRRIEIVDGQGMRGTINIPVERQLRVLIDGRPIATLWTLGAGCEWLVLGYLWNQKIITEVSALESITIEWSTGVATVISRPGATVDRIDSATALMPGAQADVPRPPPCRVSRSTLLRVLECMSREDTVYRIAGSAHGCALFCGSELWLSVEDVSRRNAVDTLSGWMALHGVTGDNLLLYSTGRLTVEIVQKAAFNGISTVVSGKGMTAACCDLAAGLGMTLFGHAARGQFRCYAGAERFDPEG